VAKVTVIVSPKPPDAFLSYTRFDDQRERGRISQLRRELADEVRAVTGEPFEIFQDVEGIGIGEHWPGKLGQMLQEARFFIPILTPSYFNSTACRDELEKFLCAEGERGRNDLVLPIYYIECDIMEDPNLRAGDPLAAEIHKRQRHDWRLLRFSSFNTKVVKTALHKLALEIVRARRRPMPEVTAHRTSAEVQVSALQRRHTAAAPRPPAVALPRRADVRGASTEVEYNGTKFTSPVESQWAVFFDTVGLKYLYKAVGFDIGGDVSYSPDVWLPELRFWVEVKLGEPTDEEKALCQLVAGSSNCTGLMAIGAPEPRDQLLVFSPRDTTGAGAFPRQDEVRFYFADDRRNEGEFWLLSDAGAAASIGPQTGPDHDRPPGLYGATRRGYEAARRARFEHCEIGSASVHLSPPDAGAELLSQPVSKETLEAYTRWKYPGLPADEKIQRLLLRDLDKDRYKTLGDLDRVVNSASDAVDHYKVEKPEWFTAGTDYLTKSLGFGDHHFRERHPFAPRTREAFVKYGHLVKSETAEPPFEPPFHGHS
jgi:hypothetical protein